MPGTLTAVLLAAVLPFMCGCLLDAGGAPDFPGSLLRTFQCSGGYGEPSVCAFSGDGRYAMAVAGERLLFFELMHGNLMGETDLGATAVDMEGTPDGGYAVVLTQESLLAVRIGGFQLESVVPLEGAVTALSVTTDGEDVWVLHDDGFVSRVGTSGWEVEERRDTGIPLAEGLVASWDGSALLVGNNGDSTVCRLRLPDMQVTASSRTYNPVQGLFRGPEGRFCGMVAGSNEVWLWDEGTCQLDCMVTVPDTPACGAAMQDGSFLYAGVPDRGLVVTRLNGEQVLVTSEFGIPGDVAIDGEGWNAVVCAPGQMSITILER